MCSYKNAIDISSIKAMNIYSNTLNLDFMKVHGFMYPYFSISYVSHMLVNQLVTVLTNTIRLLGKETLVNIGQACSKVIRESRFLCIANNKMELIIL